MGRRRQRIIPHVMLAARENRHNATQAEAVLWEALRRHAIAGFQFRRQHPVGPFIWDFYCPRAKLAVELDGPIHDRQRELDEARTESLGTLRIRVIRFRNEEVLAALADVLAQIDAAVHEPPPARRLPFW